MTRLVVINDCVRECPYVKIERTQGAGCADDYLCTKVRVRGDVKGKYREIKGYVEYPSELPKKGTFPSWCPLQVAEEGMYLEKPDNKADKKTEKRDVYMVYVNTFSGAVFVKELEFFKQQDGFTEDWGKVWFPIIATSIEDARKKGCAYPGAKPYEQQAK